eukprot:scaffold96091_cov19-Tisochrysis_lutea.AAC.2
MPVAKADSISCAANAYERRRSLILRGAAHGPWAVCQQMRNLLQNAPFVILFLCACEGRQPQPWLSLLILGYPSLFCNPLSVIHLVCLIPCLPHASLPRLPMHASCLVCPAGIYYGGAYYLGKYRGFHDWTNFTASGGVAGTALALYTIRPPRLRTTVFGSVLGLVVGTVSGYGMKCCVPPVFLFGPERPVTKQGRLQMYACPVDHWAS